MKCVHGRDIQEDGQGAPCLGCQSADLALPEATRKALAYGGARITELEASLVRVAKMEKALEMIVNIDDGPSDFKCCAGHRDASRIASVALNLWESGEGQFPTQVDVDGRT